MKRLSVLILALFLLGLPACVKVGSTTAINADNTGTMSLRLSAKTEAIARLKQQMESMAQMLGEGEDPMEDLRKLEENLDEKKLVQKLKEQGLEVTSSKSVEKEGWKQVEVEAKIPDVNVWLTKAAKEEQANEKKDPLGGMSMPSSPLSAPKLYKTATPDLAEVVIVPAMDRAPDTGMDLEDLDDEQIAMAEAQMELVKQMFSVDEMITEMTLKLPGKVQSTKGCRKVDDQTITWAFKGSEITIDGVKTFFGMKDGVSATFEIPEGFKIQLAEPPVKGTKKDDAGEKEAEKPSEKKGGLKLGEGK